MVNQCLFKFLRFCEETNSLISDTIGVSFPVSSKYFWIVLGISASYDFRMLQSKLGSLLRENFIFVRGFLGECDKLNSLVIWFIVLKYQNLCLESNSIQGLENRGILYLPLNHGATDILMLYTVSVYSIYAERGRALGTHNHPFMWTWIGDAPWLSLSMLLVWSLSLCLLLVVGVYSHRWLINSIGV